MCSCYIFPTPVLSVLFLLKLLFWIVSVNQTFGLSCGGHSQRCIKIFLVHRRIFCLSLNSSESMSGRGEDDVPLMMIQELRPNAWYKILQK